MRSVRERPRMSTPRDFQENGCWKIRWPRSPAKNRALGRPAPRAARSRSPETLMPGSVQFPMPRRALVRRVEDWVLEEGVGHIQMRASWPSARPSGRRWDWATVGRQPGRDPWRTTRDCAIMPPMTKSRAMMRPSGKKYSKIVHSSAGQPLRARVGPSLLPWPWMEQVSSVGEQCPLPPAHICTSSSRFS